MYQDDSSSSPSNTALFFTYKKSDQKMYNCYLVLNDSSDKIALPEIEVDGKSYDELRVLHEKYLKFNTGPESFRSTSDEESGVRSQTKTTAAIMSTDDMQGQPMEISAQSQEILFHGFLLFEE